MAQRSGWGGFVDSVKGLFTSAQGKQPPPQAPAMPASEKVREAYEMARPMYEEGRWRAALQTLDAVRAGESGDPRALALWIQCKASLGERTPVVAAFRTLLSLPDAKLEQLIDAYSHVGADAQLEFGPQYVERVEAAGLGPEEKARALVTVPKALWPADRLFSALASTNETSQYDELLALAKKRFKDDPRIGQVKPRPLDRYELQRQAAEEEKQRREAMRARRATFDQAGRKRGAGAADETGARLEAAVFSNRDDVQAHRVYGDWLQQQGDPRGELVIVQAERQTVRTTPS
ncbi:MAG: TIGR02996 domain-containing protein [Myxococcota bacterium]